MLFSVLTRKGKVPKAQLLLSEVQVLAKRRGSLRGSVTLLGALVQHPIWVLPPVPRSG